MPRLTPPELTANLVPVLDVSPDTHLSVADAHNRALDPDDKTELLTGTVVFVDNCKPVGVDKEAPGHTMFIIGASTLHQASTEVLAALGEHAKDMPKWVASTNDELADVLAEHHTIKGYHKCEVTPMSKVKA